MMKVTDIRLSQLYLSEEKLTRVREWFTADLHNYTPIVVRQFSWSEKPVLLDGHTRLFVAVEKGLTTLPVLFDEEVLLPEVEKLYQECAQWCEKEQLFSIADLSQRILSPKEYEEKWIGPCQNFLAQEKE